MKRKAEIRKKAKEDLDEAVDWYEGEREGLGAELLEEVKASIERIEKNPNQFAKRVDDLRAAKTKRFPYLIYYIAKKLKIFIVAILHSSRDNSKILEERNEQED